MSVGDLYERARKFGLTLEADGADLLVSPASKCPPDFVRLLKEHKTALLAWLASPPCPGWQAIPPSDLPLVTLRPHPTAEDRERVIAYLRRQTGDRPGPLTAWLMDREFRYFDGPGRKWDCGVNCYASARDAACWQTSCDERALWEFLAGFEEAAQAR
jgi:hypothetical protein